MMNTRRCELLQERQTLHISTTRLLRSPAEQKCGDLFYNKSELLQQRSSKSFFCHRLFFLPSFSSVVPAEEELVASGFAIHP
jgi:hypothetical protein